MFRPPTLHAMGASGLFSPPPPPPPPPPHPLAWEGGAPNTDTSRKKNGRTPRAGSASMRRRAVRHPPLAAVLGSSLYRPLGSHALRSPRHLRARPARGWPGVLPPHVDVLDDLLDCELLVLHAARPHRAGALLAHAQPLLQVEKNAELVALVLPLPVPPGPHLVAPPAHAFRDRWPAHAGVEGPEALP